LLATGGLLAATGGGRFAIDPYLRSPWITLPRLAALTDAALLLLRLLTGAFLIHGVWDNVASAERMGEFAGFLAASGFPAPEVMAPLSVYGQLLVGLALIPGLLTRWAGLILMFNFLVAWLMVHWGESFREAYPALVLIAFGAVFATLGAGRYAADLLFSRSGPDDRHPA
jgi:putative oxidoreductase